MVTTIGILARVCGLCLFCVSMILGVSTLSFAPILPVLGFFTYMGIFFYTAEESDRL